ncbi:hypothetical protein LMG18090_04042 [Ralstonia mannitolilytica]|uniref:hypothetical protein n=1 Tax=Ralstonia mannitolilytica TaxID=105219 RepID=UPI0028F6B613|nr:hypothetical protein [Ralstonia mannitolilytica]CAJ0800758.1 hypothetical protein LMG18090_04042 [Ralstonia mannitolilytica]
MFFKRFPLMEEAGGGAAGGGATGAPAPAPAAAAPAPAPAGAPAAAAAPAPAPALAAGATEPEIQGDFIPEKYRVSKEDGTFDIDASARKLAEAYTNAEKRIGTGDLPPKSADEYTVTVPDAMKEAFDPATDAGFKDFATKMHGLGLTQKQLDGVMESYFAMAPQLVAGAAQLDGAASTAELKKAWATDADFNRNVRNAYVGAEAIARKAGMNMDAIMGGPLGNDPTFIKLMAAIGPEFAEDIPPGGDVLRTSDQDIKSLMQSEAYTNPKHPDNARVSAQIADYYKRKFGTEAAA